VIFKVFQKKVRQRIHYIFDNEAEIFLSKM